MTMAIKTENSDSYYSGCRKTNNCLCEMCIESINATLDLMPSSLHRSALTPTSKISSLCLMPTPVARTRPVPPSPNSKTCPALESSAESTTTTEAISGQVEELGKKKGKFGDMGLASKRLIAVLSVILMASIGLVYLDREFFRTVFSPEIVHGVAVEASHLENVKDQVSFVQKRLKEIGIGKVKDCNSADSVWEIKKDGLLLHSKCVLYKSMVEEVSIWGSPLQTEGLLVTGINPRSITVLSGQLIEWKDGKMDPIPLKRNSSWTDRELSAKLVQLDPMTWLLEYRGFAFGRDLRLFRVVIEFCRLSLQRAA